MQTNPPLSEKLCDGFVLAFAAWTLLCNAVVLSEGGLNTVRTVALGAALAAVVAFLAWWRFFRGSIAASEAPEVLEEPAGETRGGVERRLPWILFLGLVVTVWVVDDTLMRWWSAVAYFLVAGLLSLRHRRSVPTLRSRRAEIAVWVLALAAAVFCFGVRADSLDDVLYVNWAVSAVDHPDAPILKWDTLIGVEELRIQFALYRVNSVEVLGALVSSLTGMDTIRVFHWFFPPLFAALGVLAFARLLRVLTPDRWIWVLSVTVLVLAFGGLNLKSYEMHFLRLQEGKAVLLVVMIPLVLAYAMRFATLPSRKRWLLLFAAQVSAIGMSANGVWLIPVTSALALAAAVPVNWRGVARFAVGLTASGYVLVVGVYLVLQQPAYGFREGVTVANVSRVVSENFDRGETLATAWSQMFGTAGLSAVGFLAVTAAWLIVPPGRARRLTTLLPLGLLVFLFNPYLAPYLTSRLIGPHNMIRVLWPIPFPALVAILLCAPLLASKRPRAAGFAMAGVLAAGYLAYAPMQQARGISTTRWEVFGLRAPAYEYRLATELADSAPPGTYVVAPQKVSTWVPTVHGYPFPLISRARYFGFQRRRMNPQDARLRQALVGYVSGDGPRDGGRLLRCGFEEYDLRGVAFSKAATYTKEIRSALREHGLKPISKSSRYEIWAVPE